MTITLNGQAKQLDNTLSLTELVRQIGLSDKHVVIEYNYEPLEKEHYEKTQLRDGDNVEIVTMMSGG